MNLTKPLALALVIACSAACDDSKTAKASGASNSATTSATNNTAAQAKLLTPPPAAGSLPIEATGPVATVDGVEITAAEYNEEVGRLVQMMGNQAPPGMLVNLKGQIIDQLVAKKLVDGAVKSGNIAVPDAEVDAEFGKFKAQLDEAAPGGATAYLAKLGRTEAEMKGDVRKSLELKAIMAKEHDINVPEAELKKFYDENKTQFDQPGRVKASHILLKLEKDAPADKVKEVKAKADGIAKQAKAPGADFAALATANSEGPTAPRGGDLGYFVKGQMVPEFDAAAWKMKPGEISDPVRTDFGFHIIKVDDRKEAKSMTYAEAKDLILAKLQEPKLKEAMTATIESLKAKAKIERMEQNIKSNVAAPTAPPGMPGMGGHPPMTPPPGQGGPPPKLKLDQMK